MRKYFIMVLLSLCLTSYSQYQPRKHKKPKKEIQTKFLAIGGGLVFITAGTISMKSKGEIPFVDNKTKWKMSPSEWAIVGGFTVITFGIIYKF